jgi:hypothetical protein
MLSDWAHNIGFYPKGNLKSTNVQDAINEVATMFPGRNKIINGNFDVWQRGTSFTNSIYTADRWGVRAYGSVGGTQTISRQAFDVGQTEVPNNPTYFHRIDNVNAISNTYIYQKIEDVGTFAGKTATLSFYARYSTPQLMTVTATQIFGSGGSSQVSTPAIQFTPTASWKKFTIQMAIPSISGKIITTNHNLHIQITTSAIPNGTFDLAQVQLEEGNVATPFEQRHIQQELALCQRYYRKKVATVAAQAFGIGQVLATNTVYMYDAFPVEMRKIPGLSVSSLQSSTATGTGITANTANIANATEYGCTIALVMASSSFVTGDASIVSSIGAGSFIAYDAEL